MRADIRPVRELRDLPVVDCDGRLCGVVDEVLFERTADGGLVLAAIAIGPGAWTDRLPGWALAVVRRLAGERKAVAPWREVASVTGRVTLAGRAADFGLGVLDRRLRAPLSKVPDG